MNLADWLALGLSFGLIMFIAAIIKLIEGRYTDPGNRYGDKYNDWESY